MIKRIKVIKHLCLVFGSVRTTVLLHRLRLPLLNIFPRCFPRPEAYRGPAIALLIRLSRDLTTPRIALDTHTHKHTLTQMDIIQVDSLKSPHTHVLSGKPWILSQHANISHISGEWRVSYVITTKHHQLPKHTRSDLSRTCFFDQKLVLVLPHCFYRWGFMVLWVLM